MTLKEEIETGIAEINTSIDHTIDSMMSSSYDELKDFALMIVKEVAVRDTLKAILEAANEKDNERRTSDEA